MSERVAVTYSTVKKKTEELFGVKMLAHSYFWTGKTYYSSPRKLAGNGDKEKTALRMEKLENGSGWKTKKVCK